jgi:mannitol-1-/sugar-/sorbitol-6-phosphatase
VALTTTADREQLVADVVVKDLSAVSVKAVEGGLDITAGE